MMRSDREERKGHRSWSTPLPPAMLTHRYAGRAIWVWLFICVDGAAV